MPDSALRLDVDIGGVVGHVTVTVLANTSPESIGCDAAARGFPVCEAVVDSPLRGYAALLGWIQVVGTRRAADAEWRFETDPLQIFAGIEVPFAFFGINPTLFDAPYRRDRDQRLDWLAHSFLCAPSGAPASHTVRPVAAYQWGFLLDTGSIQLVGAQPLPLQEWARHRDLLSSAYPSWDFATIAGGTDGDELSAPGTSQG